MSRKSRSLSLLVVAAAVLAAGSFFSGRYTAGAAGGGGGFPPPGPPAPSGYTLDDLYTFVASDGTSLPVPGSHALVPASAPGEGDMRTVEEVLDLLRTRLPCDGGGGGLLPDSGQTKCYDEFHLETACSGTGACAGQDGLYRTGCPLEGRFVDHGDGTVTDTCTGLIWQKVTAPGTHTWCEALAYCESLDLAGHEDWRLPSVRELQSIADYGRKVPSAVPVFGALSESYWSSTSYAFDSASAWYVNFFGGWVGIGDKLFDEDYVRAVRSAP